MKARRRWTRAIAALGALSLLTACPMPARDPCRIKAIKDESRALMASHPPAPITRVPRGQWGPVITSLKPEIVWVSEDGVDILVKAYFDGGWGYYVPRDERMKVNNPCRYSAIGQGVYWFNPC